MENNQELLDKVRELAIRQFRNEKDWINEMMDYEDVIRNMVDKYNTHLEQVKYNNMTLVLPNVYVDENFRRMMDIKGMDNILGFHTDPTKQRSFLMLNVPVDINTVLLDLNKQPFLGLSDIHRVIMYYPYLLHGRVDMVDRPLLDMRRLLTVCGMFHDEWLRETKYVGLYNYEETWKMRQKLR